MFLQFELNCIVWFDIFVLYALELLYCLVWNVCMVWFGRFVWFGLGGLYCLVWIKLEIPSDFVHSWLSSWSQSLALPTNISDIFSGIKIRDGKWYWSDCESQAQQQAHISAGVYFRPLHDTMSRYYLRANVNVNVKELSFCQKNLTRFCRPYFKL